MVTVSYDGFLGSIVRTFPTMKRAIQWIQQVGIKDRNPQIYVS